MSYFWYDHKEQYIFNLSSFEMRCKWNRFRKATFEKYIRDPASFDMLDLGKIIVLLGSQYFVVEVRAGKDEKNGRKTIFLDLYRSNSNLEKLKYISTSNKIRSVKQSENFRPRAEDEIGNMLLEYVNKTRSEKSAFDILVKNPRTDLRYDESNWNRLQNVTLDQVKELVESFFVHPEGRRDKVKEFMDFVTDNDPSKWRFIVNVKKVPWEEMNVFKCRIRFVGIRNIEPLPDPELPFRFANRFHSANGFEIKSNGMCRCEFYYQD